MGAGMHLVKRLSVFVATLLAAVGFASTQSYGNSNVQWQNYEAIGTVTNLSARLCQEARDGQILVSEPVHAEVESLVEAKPVGALPLRGFSRPVVVFDVLGLRPQSTAPAAAP